MTEQTPVVTEPTIPDEDLKPLPEDTEGPQGPKPKGVPKEKQGQRGEAPEKLKAELQDMFGNSLKSVEVFYPNVRDDGPPLLRGIPIVQLEDPNSKREAQTDV